MYVGSDDKKLYAVTDQIKQRHDEERKAWSKQHTKLIKEAQRERDKMQEAEADEQLDSVPTNQNQWVVDPDAVHTVLWLSCRERLESTVGLL